MQIKVPKLTHVVKTLTQKLRRRPGIDEICAQTGWSAEVVGQLLFLQEPVLALDAPLGDSEGFSLSDTVADNTNQISEVEMRVALLQVIERLPDKNTAKGKAVERAIYRKILEGMKDGEICEETKVSPATVSRYRAKLHNMSTTLRLDSTHMRSVEGDDK